jgi:hypothetical protein
MAAWWSRGSFSAVHWVIEQATLQGRLAVGDTCQAEAAQAMTFNRENFAMQPIGRKCVAWTRQAIEVPVNEAGDGAKRVFIVPNL